MRRLTSAILGLALFALVGCASELTTFDQERFFSRLSAVENDVEGYVKRYNWATEKSERYAELVTEAERDLGTLRGDLRDLEERNTRRAKELQGLRDEATKMEAEVAALQASLGEKQGLRDSVTSSIADLEQQQAGELEKRRAMAERLDQIKLENAAFTAKIEALRQELGLSDG